MSPAPPAQYPKRPGSRNGSAPVAHGFELSIMTRHNRNYVTNTRVAGPAGSGVRPRRRLSREVYLPARRPPRSSRRSSPPTPHRPPTTHGTSWSSPLGAPRSTYRTSTCTSFQSPDAISPCDRHQFQSAPVSVGTVSVGTVSVGLVQARLRSRRNRSRGHRSRFGLCGVRRN